MAEDDVKREVVDDASAMPRINTLVRVAVYADGDLEGHPTRQDIPSRTEEVVLAQSPGERHVLMIASPRYVGDLDELAVGTLCSLTWPTERGLMELPVAYLGEQYIRNSVEVWRVEVVGPAVRTERRKFFRVTMTLPVRVEVLPGGIGIGAISPSTDVTLEGHTVDLSEGGLRCVLPGPELPIGGLLTVWVEVERVQMELRASVVWSGAVEGRDESMCETALRFVDPERFADAMRRIVYAEQMRARRLERDDD
ncbi:MAG: PilZ domain-containing protein [Actinomycetales bacterium]|nr:PilZ domain-containing protein [Actinomycetales bacterium]